MREFVMRKIDNLGRIVIPSEALSAMRLTKNNPVKISFENNKIIIEKAVPTCIICGSSENIIGPQCICKECIKNLKAE